MNSLMTIIKGYNIQFQQRVQAITTLLDNKKATNISYYDFCNNDYFTDMVVLANSLNNRHALALLDELKILKPQETFLQVDNKSAEWIIADLGDIIVHIIDPEYRVWYDLDNFFSQMNKPVKI